MHFFKKGYMQRLVGQIAQESRELSTPLISCMLRRGTRRIRWFSASACTQRGKPSDQQTPKLDQAVLALNPQYLSDKKPSRALDGLLGEILQENQGNENVEQWKTSVLATTNDEDPGYSTFDEYTNYCQTPGHAFSLSHAENGLRLAGDGTQFATVTKQGLQQSLDKYSQISSAVATSLNGAGKRFTFDLTHPASWFPQARAIPRKVYLHIGPTNSGKTYTALQRFKNSKTGFYAGPLRLLAKEVYNRLKGTPNPCNLVTGEEVIEEYDENGDPVGLSSGTVEMVDLKSDLDIAVIDEIQMIEDRDRGWSWTNAFLGVKAKEVHLCGDPNSESIVKKLVASTGDHLEVVRYKRLSPLQVSKQSLDGKLENLKPGDCVVGFSKKDLYMYKSLIEDKKKGKCAMIYGSLPADTRAQQAMEFNDPDSKYKYLVASDAIGMGLNLAIKRVVFTTTSKFNGIEETLVPVAQVKQIGGRAGRFKIAQSHSRGSEDPTEKVDNEETGVGEVTTLYRNDLRYVDKCMASVSPRIAQAGLFPTDELLKRYSSRFPPDMPFHVLLQTIVRSNRVSLEYFMSNLDNLVKTAKLFADETSLTFEEKMTLCKAPVQLRQEAVCNAFRQFCRQIVKGVPTNILGVPGTGLHKLKDVIPPGRSTVLEDIHRIINLYLWLAYRFPTIFIDRIGALELKALCERKINRQISSTSAMRMMSKHSRHRGRPKKAPHTKHPGPKLVN